MTYQSDPSGLGVGVHYGPRIIGTVDGVLNTKGSELDVTLKLESGDTSGPHEVIIPPFCTVKSVTEMTHEAWSSSKKVVIKLGDKEIITSGGIALGTTIGSHSMTLTATAADLETGDKSKTLSLTPPTDTKGYSIIVVKLLRA